MLCTVSFQLRRGSSTVRVVHPQKVGDQDRVSKLNSLLKIDVNLAGKRAALYFRLDKFFLQGRDIHLTSYPHFITELL